MQRRASLIIPIMLTLVLGTLLTACGGGGTSDKVTLHFVSWQSKGEYKDILNAFMKQYPNITVQDEALDGNTYDQLLKPRIVGGNEPDVFAIMPSQFSTYVKQGWLADVTNATGTASLKAATTLSSVVTVNGKIYAVPVDGGYTDAPVYYDKALFTQLGLSIPQSTDDLLAACAKIKATGKDCLAFGGHDSWTVNTLMDAVTNPSIGVKYGPDYDVNYALAKGQLTVKDVYSDEFNFFAGLANAGYIGKASVTQTYPQSLQYFLDGKSGMITQGTWVPAEATVATAKSNGYQLNAFAFPTAQYNGKHLTFEGFDQEMVVSSASQHPKEALELYNFIMQKDNLKTYFLDLHGYFPATPDIAPKIDASLQAYFTAHQSYTVYVYPASKAAIPSAFSSALTQAYVNMISGSSADVELQRVQGVLDSVRSQITFTN